jgi:gas vesicle protein
MALDYDVYESITKLLKHIKSVQKDIVNNTRTQSVDLIDFLNEQGVKPDKRVLNILQYQDILTQQLDAINETVEQISQNLIVYSDDLDETYKKISRTFDELNDKLNVSIEDAKSKRDRFNGRFKGGTGEEEEEVEFF